MKYLRSLVRLPRNLANLGPTLGRFDRRIEEIRSRQTYALIDQLQQRAERPARQDVDLRLAELRIFSQNGEDGIIDAILRAIGDSPQFFVEFGVQDGSECNTRLLAEFCAWSGASFEPDAPQHSLLCSRYSGVGRVSIRHDAITPENVDQLFMAQ